MVSWVVMARPVCPLPWPSPRSRGEGTRLKRHETYPESRRAETPLRSLSPHAGRGSVRRAAAISNSPERLAQARQDLLGIEFQEPPLIRAGGVEDEMAEAEFDVGPDLLDLLVGVVRHDPAARRPIERQGVGETFHL